LTGPSVRFSRTDRCEKRLNDCKPHSRRAENWTVAMALGVGLDYAGLDAVQMLFWSAVVNGVLAPPLIVLVVLLTSDRSVMVSRHSYIYRTLRV
jgi:Mn2+/Fe2+ NRAMP family transporter